MCRSWPLQGIADCNGFETRLVLCIESVGHQDTHAAVQFGDQKGWLGHVLTKIYQYFSFFLLPFSADLSTGQLGNTALVWHNGKLLALMEAGFPFLLRVCSGAVRSISSYTFGGALEHEVSAHPKVDPRSGEMLGFAYGCAPTSTLYTIRVRLMSCSLSACWLACLSLQVSFPGWSVRCQAERTCYVHLGLRHYSYGR